MYCCGAGTAAGIFLLIQLKEKQNKVMLKALLD